MTQSPSDFGVAQAGGRPVADATVYLDDLPSIKTKSKADGSFELTGVPPGEHFVVGEKEGEGGMIKVRATASVGDPSVSLTAAASQPSIADLRSLLMRRTGSIVGKINLMNHVGDALGADVFIPGSTLIAKAKEDGTFALVNVAEGDYRITASRTGFEPKTMDVAVKAGKSASVDFVLLKQDTSVKGARFIGVVLDSDGKTPMAGVLVALSNGINQTSISNQAGQYEFVNVPLGSYTVAFSKQGYKYKSIDAIVNGEAVTNRLRVTLPNTTLERDGAAPASVAPTTMPSTTPASISPTVQPSSPPTQATPTPGVTGSGSVVVTTLEGLTLNSAATLNAATGSNKVYLPNNGAPLFVSAQGLTTASVTNETISGQAKAVAFSGTNRYYLTVSAIVKPDGSSVTLTGVNSSSDMAIVGNHAYITSETQHVIYKVDLSTGAGSLFAGTPGTPGYSDGAPAATRFSAPRGITYDTATGALYVADSANRSIRKVTLTGAVSSFAGSGHLASTDGVGSAASFKLPNDLTSDGAGNFYVADYGANNIRRISSGREVTTIAGNGTNASTDGSGPAASFRFPMGIAYGTISGMPVLWVGEQNKIRIVRNWQGTTSVPM